MGKRSAGQEPRQKQGEEGGKEKKALPQESLQKQTDLITAIYSFISQQTKPGENYSSLDSIFRHTYETSRKMIRLSFCLQAELRVHVHVNSMCLYKFISNLCCMYFQK